MKKLATLALLAVSAPLAFAGPFTYQCVINEHLMLDESGTLQRPPRPYHIGQRFTIDRRTGRVIDGDDAFSYPMGTHQVLAHGNADNAFIATISSPAGGNGVHFVAFRVNEYAEGKTKPMIVMDGGVLVSGRCE